MYNLFIQICFLASNLLQHAVPVFTKNQVWLPRYNASNLSRGCTPASNPERGNNIWAKGLACEYHQERQRMMRQRRFFLTHSREGSDCDYTSRMNAQPMHHGFRSQCREEVQYFCNSECERFKECGAESGRSRKESGCVWETASWWCSSG